MKKILSITIILCITLSHASISLAEEGVNNKTELSEILKNAFEYDQNNRVKDIEISFAQGEAEEAGANAKNPGRREAVEKQYKSLSTAMQRIWTDIIPEEKQFEVYKLSMAEKDYYDALAQDVTFAYYKALYSSINADLIKIDDDISKSELNIAETNNTKGLLSDIGLKEAELKKEQSSSTLQNAINETDEAYTILKDLTGITDKELLLDTADIKQVILPTYAKEAFIDLLKKNDTSYICAIKDQEFKQKRCDVYNSLGMYSHVNEEKIAAEKALLLANINLKKVAREEISGSYTEYMDLLNMKGDLDIEKEKIEIMKVKMEQKQLKYNLGLITELESKKAEQEYKKAELKLKQDMNEYNRRVGLLMIKLN